MNANEFIEKLKNGIFDEKLRELYSNIEIQKSRYEKAVTDFLKNFPNHTDDDISVFSAPGRTEIGGNHTDHQHGCVLAAAIDLDIIAVVCFTNKPQIRIISDKFPMNTVDLSDLSVQENEIGKSNALIRGIVSKFNEAGAEVSGFDAYTTSDVLSGSGLSSSAAFEILIGTITNSRYNNGKASTAELAKFGQYAENVYYGKNSGLMDQMACSVGGMVFIDFYDTENPVIKPINRDLSQYGYDICIVDTKGSHSDLSDDYGEIRSEMCGIAEYFGCKYLRDVDHEDFMENIPKLREKCSDRAILRAMHFFDENHRAFQESNAIEKENLDYFFGMVRQSGESSAALLQNLYSVKKPTQQQIPLAIEMSKRILNGEGAVRVHGGGFAGTIQAFVPLKLTEKYKTEMEKLFGKDSCYILKVRPVGGIEITGR